MVNAVKQPHIFTMFDLRCSILRSFGDLTPRLSFQGLQNFMSDENGKEMKIHFAHGTTTLAFKYNGGVIVCADSRATGGNYIGKSQ